MILSVAGLSAMTWTDWSLDAGFGLVINANLDESAGDGKEPADLLFYPGASFHGDFDGEAGGWYFRPGFWFSWNLEEVYNGIARPCDEAELSHMKVLGLMMDFPFGYAFSAGKMKIGVQGGPAVYARFPLYTAQLGDGEPSEFWTAYYGAVQFLNLSLSSWVSFPLSGGEGEYSGNDMLVGIRAYYPVSNLWTDAPFFHTMQVGLVASLRFGMKQPE